MSRLEKPPQQAQKSRGLQSILNFATAKEQPKTSKEQPSTSKEQSSRSKGQSSTSKEQLQTSKEPLQTSKELLQTSKEQSSTSKEQPGTSRNQPSITNLQQYLTDIDDEEFTIESSYMDNSLVSNRQMDIENNPSVRTKVASNKQPSRDTVTLPPPLPNLPSLDSSFSFTPGFKEPAIEDDANKVVVSDVRIEDRREAENLYMPSPSQVRC